MITIFFLVVESKGKKLCIYFPLFTHSSYNRSISGHEIVENLEKQQTLLVTGNLESYILSCLIERFENLIDLCSVNVRMFVPKTVMPAAHCDKKMRRHEK
jgi:hypothetical protein